MRVALRWTATWLLLTSSLAVAQHASEQPTPLAQLLAEVRESNSQISAANHAWKAASYASTQAAALPDTKLTLQEFSVGSPRPFAGYTNSDFAYIGFGVSQDLPYPGKLRLRGEVASRAAEALHAQVGVTEAGIVDAVKSDYLQLAYLQETLGILNQSKFELDQLIQDATIHYEVGQGMQQDVLQAQIERTKLVREVAMHHQQVAQLQAHLKGLLHRDQQTPDIVTEPLRETAMAVSDSDLARLVKTGNAQVHADLLGVREQDARLAAAKREGKPDFGLSYMYENTDRKYRDYYVLTVDVHLPRRKRVDAEIAQAAESLAQSKDTLDAHVQEQGAEVERQFVRATSDSEILKDYREGLMPQSEAAYRATVSAYAANREQFAHVASAFLSLLNLRLESLQTLADHEIALARLETLTGATIR